jgi:hypothetical protein
MSDDKATLTVSWKIVAIGATIVALTALVLCAIVATIDKADTLSVVALGLAVIAFIIQIIVFIVQAAAAAQQDLKAQEIYGSTLRVLATIEEKAEGTQRTVSTMSDRMLAALLEKVIPETANAGVSIASPEFSSVVAERVGELVRTQDSNPTAPSTSALTAYDLMSPRTDMYTFPDLEEVQHVAPLMADLPYLAFVSLTYLGEDLSKSPVIGLTVLNEGRALYEKGLVHRIRRGSGNNPVYVLTPDGAIAARALLSDDVPDDVPPEILRGRAEIKKHEAALVALRRQIASEEAPIEAS